TFGRDAAAMVAEVAAAHPAIVVAELLGAVGQRRRCQVAVEARELAGIGGGAAIDDPILADTELRADDRLGPTAAIRLAGIFARQAVVAPVVGPAVIDVDQVGLRVHHHPGRVAAGAPVTVSQVLRDLQLAGVLDAHDALDARTPRHPDLHRLGR